MVDKGEIRDSEEEGTWQTKEESERKEKEEDGRGDNVCKTSKKTQP